MDPTFVVGERVRVPHPASVEELRYVEAIVLDVNVPEPQGLWATDPDHPRCGYVVELQTRVGGVAWVPQRYVRPLFEH